MQWFYLDANQLQVPADESELGGLIQNGTITAETLLWNETMSDWEAAASLFPDWFAEAGSAEVPVAEPPQDSAPMVTRPAPKLAAGGATKIGLVKRPIQTARSAVKSGGDAGLADEETQPRSDLIRDLASFIGARAGWIKFFAIVNIINGVLACLTVVGAVVGWLPIWLGVILLKVANLSVSAQYSGSQEELEEALDRAGFYFKLQGILIFVVLVFMAINIAVLFVSGFASMFVIQPPE